MDRDRLPILKMGGKPIQAPSDMRTNAGRTTRAPQDEQTDNGAAARQQQTTSDPHERPCSISHRMFSFYGQFVHYNSSTCALGLAESERLPLVGDTIEEVWYEYPAGALGDDLHGQYGRWKKMTLNGWPLDAQSSPCPCVQFLACATTALTLPPSIYDYDYFALVNEGNGCYLYYLRTFNRLPPLRGSTSHEWVKAGPIEAPYKLKMITLGCHDIGEFFLLGLVDDNIVNVPRLVLLNSPKNDGHGVRWNFSEPWSGISWNGLNRLDYIHLAERIPSYSQAATRSEAQTDLVVILTDINGKTGCLSYVRELDGQPSVPGGERALVRSRSTLAPTRVRTPVCSPGWHCNTEAFLYVAGDLPGSLLQLKLCRAQSQISCLDPSLGYHIFMAFVDEPLSEFHNRIVYNYIADEEPVYPFFHMNWIMSPVTAIAPTQFGAISNNKDELYYAEGYEGFPLLSRMESTSWPPSFGSGTWVMAMVEAISGAQLLVFPKIDPSVRYGIDTCKFPVMYRTIFAITSIMDDPAELAKIVYSGSVHPVNGCSWWQDNNPDWSPAYEPLFERGDERAERRRKRHMWMMETMMRRLQELSTASRSSSPRQLK